MDISYLGHSAFKIKGKQGVVVTDPFDKSVGFSMPSVAADVVTVSHQHADHDFVSGIAGTPKREKPWLVLNPGEYEISGITVFGYKTYHDSSEGKDRGNNTVFQIVMDGINIVHLGDLGHQLSDSFIEALGTVDVLMCPVGGVFTLDPAEASEIIQSIEPSYVLPMHYKTEKHASSFQDMKSLEDFQKVFGVKSDPIKSLSVSATLPEQTTLVVFG